MRPEVELPPANIGELIVAQRFSKEEKAEHRRIIKEFTDLYHTYKHQTWGNTYWRGVPIFKTPTDLWIYQELIEQLRPDLIIETGTCCGGSALYLRNMLDLIFPSSRVLSIDITHEHIHKKVREHDGIGLILGSSIDSVIVDWVKKYIEDAYAQRVMVILDSNHAEEHVLNELELYGPLVSKGCALIVEDTNTPGPDDAIAQWEPLHPEFQVSYMCEKFMLTFNRAGYFERVV